MTRKLSQGNEAVFRGALAAGASYYAGYPISPSTEILNVASGHAAEHPEFRFLQAEDEIASANAVIGASLAGAKSFTATSGPGFSLMQEAVGYAQKVGVPCVFVNVQRVGPATGMPTMPGQGDLMQVKWGSTGDYTPIAFYPNGVEEAFRVTVEAFNAAEESRSPVVILSDTFVAHLNEVVDLDAVAGSVEVVDRAIPALGDFTDEPRFFAGVLMYEHGPNSGEPATADADEYMRQFYAAKHLHHEVAARHARFEHGWNVDADVLVVCYGIVSRVAAPLRDEFALFRPIRIHPILGDELREIAPRYREVVVVEANDGQYADLVELAIHREVKRVPLLGGRISLEAVREGIDRVLAGGPSEPPIPPEPAERGPRAPLGVG
ncbi:MAG: 2-oxoacid:acceptor oxidoreductase subunit alpha [Candidatus Limnocylindria bacterium]